MGMTPGHKQSAEHVERRIAARLATLAAKPKQVSRDWLVAHYTLLGMDCAQIGRMVGRDAKTVWSWMRHYDIPTRSRGGFTSPGCFQKGAPSAYKIALTDQMRKESSKRAKAARLSDGRVPYLKDGKHWLHHEGAVHPNWKGGITPERQAFYLTPEWVDAVKAVWARADATCERCGKHHNTAESRGTFHVHHIVSFMVRELRAVPSNLALLCRPCHLFVHSNANTEKQFLEISNGRS